MAWHTTHTIGRTATATGMAVTVSLLQDLGSAPGSVKVLPLLAEGAAVEWAFSTELGEGVLAFWSQMGFENDGEILDLLETSNPDTIRLVVEAGGQRLFVGRPDPVRVDRPTTEVARFTATFSDGMREAKRLVVNPSGQSQPWSLLDVVLAESAVAAIAALDGLLPLVAHDWTPVGYPSPAAPDGTNWSVFDRITVPGTALAAGTSATYAQLLTALLPALLAHVGYAPSLGRFVAQYVRSGASGAAYTAVDTAGFGDTVSVDPQAVTLVRRGTYRSPRFGSVFVTIESESGYTGLDFEAGTAAAGLDTERRTWPFVPDAYVSRTAYVYQVGGGPPIGKFTGTEVDGDMAGGEGYADEVIARILFAWLGTPRVRLKDATALGFVDPMRPCTIDALGATRVYRAVRGRYDLVNGTTDALGLIELSTP